MARQVTVYSTPTCPYSKKTKEWMAKHNIQFTDRNVAADKSAAQEMMALTGQTGVPVWKVSEDGITKRIVVGYDVLSLEEEFSS